MTEENMDAEDGGYVLDCPYCGTIFSKHEESGSLIEYVDSCDDVIGEYNDGGTFMGGEFKILKEIADLLERTEPELYSEVSINTGIRLGEEYIDHITQFMEILDNQFDEVTSLYNSCDGDAPGWGSESYQFIVKKDFQPILLTKLEKLRDRLKEEMED